MKVFITGITGTVGTALAKLHRAVGDEVNGCARSEDRAVRWLKVNKGLALLSVCDAFVLMDRKSQIGDVISKADVVYHCAAMKHVDLCEEHPHEAFKQNVELTCLIAEACQRQGTRLVFCSTDKACLPQSVYGASKLIGERAVLACGGAAVRLGNVIGSSGSVFQKWAQQDVIELTDPDMTRFFIPVHQAAVYLANVKPGELLIPRLQAARMGDVADELGKDVVVVGRRPGETQHQWLDVLPDGPEYAWSRSETAPRWNVRELLKEAGVI